MRRDRPPVPGADRFGIFVPAIMSVGLLFWLATLTRDLFRWHGEQVLRRRSRLAGTATARFVLGEPEPSAAPMPGLRIRRSYLLVATIFGGVSAYIVIGSTANYLQQGGYVGDIAWLLAVSLLVAAFFAAVAGISLTVFVAWPVPPAALRGILRRTPLTFRPPAEGEPEVPTPSWALSLSLTVLPLAFLVLTLAVATSRDVLLAADRAVRDWALGQSWLGWADVADPSRAVLVVVVLALVVGAAALRCRTLAVAVPLACAAGVGAVVTASAFTDLARSADSSATTGSYPNGRVALAIVVAGLVPTAVAVLARRPRLVAPLRLVGSVAVAGTVLAVLHEGAGSITDVVGGTLVGLSVVLGVDWAVAHGDWHDHCRGCLWHPDAEAPPLLSAIPIGLGTSRGLRVLAHLAAVAAVVGLVVLTLTRSVPANPDGSLLGEQIQQPIQLALAGLVSVGALVAWRWSAVGAVLIAIAGVGLGVFAGLEYRPEIAIAMTAALLVPSVLLWLTWQHRRRRWELVVLAVTTLALLGATWTGANYVYGHYFGATHPDSAAPSLPVDRVEWVWSGDLTATGATVVTRPVEGARRVAVELVPDGGGARVRTDVVDVDPAGIARVHTDRLAADTSYSYRVLVDGVADTSRGAGHLRTPADGPMSFTVAFASCARVGSNGAVFDAIAAKHPLLYVNTGDLHYSNLDSTAVSDFRRAYDRLLEEPGQAALYRDVPIGYMWDDHDYGPNDADASSPTRPAARLAYREVVPHYPLPGRGDAPIYQAFTIGRVRFVMTDNRSERRPGSMLGDAQQRWLIDELVQGSRTHAVVVWVNPDPWVGKADPTSDAWPGFARERHVIADAIADNGVRNLVMVSGDAHMVAIDDGTNTDYSTSRTGGFPLLQAAALDRPGNVKGGPYSEGAFPGGGQFGTVEVHDDGPTVTVGLAGWNWTGERIVAEDFTFPRSTTG